MASWDPLSMAQDVIRCTLCEDAPVELNCDTCQVGLCDGCVSKHITSKKYSKHDIVPFIAGKSEIKLPECKSHSSVKCDFHCRQCNIPVCVKCVASSHRNHNFVEMSDSLASFKESIKQETIELETIIAEEYEKVKTETKAKLTKLQNEYQNLKKIIFDHGKLWHEEVDVIIAKIIEDIERMEKKDLTTLKNQLTEMENILADVRNTAEKNKQILKSNDTIKIFTHKSRNDEFCYVPVTTELFPPTFKPLKIEGQKLSQQFGKLTSSIESSIAEYKIKMKDRIQTSTSIRKLLEVPLQVATYDTGEYIYSMVTINNDVDDQLWIGRVGRMVRIDIHGTKMERINTTLGNTHWGLTMTQEGHLVYTDWFDSTVNLVRSGQKETVIRTGKWKPTGVYYTSTGHLLVGLFKGDKNKLVRYSKDYKQELEIKSDDNNKSLFAEGGNFLITAENRDQSILVSDPNAHKVLLLNQAGHLQTCYYGNLESQRYKSFDPWGIATNCQSQILVADRINNCIHILNQNGKFLRYIDNCHLNRPECLSIDRSDELFVSCRSTIKKIQYLK